MALNLEQVRRTIDVDEPEYTQLARRLGREALPHLLTLVEQGDPSVAPKAAYLASLIPGPGSLAVLEAASRSEVPSVRVAAAAAVRNTGEAGAEFARQLLADADPGVRKTALLSSAAVGPGLQPAVREVAGSDPEEELRRLATKVLQEIER